MGAEPATRTNPAAFLYGPGHMIVHGNAAFVRAFGDGCLGQPAREALLDMPPEAFELMDLVFSGGRPLARRIRVNGREWRLVVVPRRDPETGETYGVATHLRPFTQAEPASPPARPWSGR